jgi:hypothetical protein
MTDDHAALHAHIRRILTEHLLHPAKSGPRGSADRPSPQNGQALRQHVRGVLRAWSRRTGTTRRPDRSGR